MTVIYQDVLTEAKAKLQGLALPGIASNVQVMKLPGVDEQIDTLPLLALVPADEPEEIKRLDFEGTKNVTYVMEVVAISKGKKLLGAEGNGDPNDNLFRQLDWRQQVRDLFYNQAALSAVPQVRRITVAPGKPVDRRKVSQNYEYAAITVRVVTRE